MAKVGRIISSGSERLLEVPNNHRYHCSHSEEVPMVTDFEEDDVWSMVEDLTEPHHYMAGYGCEWTPRATVENGRQIRRGYNNKQVGALSLAFEDNINNNTNNNRPQDTSASRSGIVQQSSWGPPHDGERHVATSAPVNVPGWTKILRNHDSDDDDRTGADSGMEPPHEYLARSRKMKAFSVYEGVGRTLKGRDMSQVRDAVWNRTGFEG